jgi:hypothetical protein
MGGGFGGGIGGLESTTQVRGSGADVVVRGWWLVGPCRVWIGGNLACSVVGR